MEDPRTTSQKQPQMKNKIKLQREKGNQQGVKTAHRLTLEVMETSVINGMEYQPQNNKRKITKARSHLPLATRTHLSPNPLSQ